MDDVPIQRRLGPIRLAPGVRPGQIFVFMFVVVSALCIVTFLPMMQAFVFTEMLHVPKAEQGRLAGNLTTVQQIAVLLFVGLSGSLTDRIGRKRVLVIAICGYVLCLVAYPLAGGVATLFLLQFVFGALSTGHIAGSATMIVDYPDNASRGKFIALMLLVQAGATALLVGWLGARLPSWLVGSGLGASLAGRYAFWAMAGLGLVGALVAFFMLENPPRAVRPGTAPAPTPARSLGVALSTFIANLRLVVAHGRRNARFGLVMLMGFVIRSDYFVMLSFVSLWVVNAATGQGVTSAEALKTAGALMVTFKLATAVAQLLFGFVADRVNRTLLLVTSLTLTGLALASTILVHDVFGLGMFVVVAFIGVTESALIVCGQAILGEEAPVELRGSALGIFYFCGTLGVVVMSFVSGFLFDKVGYSAPFVMVGLLNLLFAAFAVVLVWRRRGEATDEVPKVSHAG
jgi:MFS family permease